MNEGYREGDKKERKSFWTKLSTIFTGFAALVTGVTGLVALLHSGPETQTVAHTSPPVSAAVAPAVSTTFHPDSSVAETSLPAPQQVRWGPNDGKPAGICIGSCEKEFVGWTELNDEILQKLLPQVAKIPAGCYAAVRDFYGKKDWVVSLVSPKGKAIGYIWFGADPERNYRFDGLIRVGSKNAPVKVWGKFQRYSDGSYRSL